MSSSRSSPADREGARVRMSRYRARRKVREGVAEKLRQALGREPSRVELREAINAELQDHRDNSPALPARAGRPSSQEARAIEKVAMGGLSLELQIVEHRDEIFELLIAAARSGDVSSALWLGSRIVPVARQRATVRVDDLASADLSSADSCVRAIEAVIRQVGAGTLDLGSAEAIVGLIERRMRASKIAAEGAAFALAAEKMSEGDDAALPREIAELRKRFAARGEARGEMESDDAAGR